MNKNKTKITVFVPMGCDFIHEGHINIINIAATYGEVVIGLLTNEAIMTYKNAPVFNYEQRFKMVSALKNVSSVIKTNEWDYRASLEKIKPKIIIHGDDWKKNNQSIARDNVINQIRKWDGKLIEAPYTKGISSTQIKEALIRSFNPSFLRSGLLKKMLKKGELVKVLEVHNGLSGLIVENAEFKDKKFDGMWLSSLTHSAIQAKPDIEYVDVTTIAKTITDIFDVTSKPLILDGDSGGDIEHFCLMIGTMLRLGVSSVIIEDKVGSKVNSLSSNSSSQKQDSISNFSKKISAGKKIIGTSDLLLIARIESLILGNGLKDALKRAKKYIDAGADGILIHSKDKKPDEIFAFCSEYNKFPNRKPLFVVPSSYNIVTEKQLASNGVNVVIYANHLLRSAYPAMVNTAQSILKYGSSSKIDSKLLSIKNIVELIPGKNS